MPKTVRPSKKQRASRVTPARKLAFLSLKIFVVTKFFWSRHEEVSGA